MDDLDNASEGQLLKGVRVLPVVRRVVFSPVMPKRQPEPKKAHEPVAARPGSPEQRIPAPSIDIEQVKEEAREEGFRAGRQHAEKAAARLVAGQVAEQVADQVAAKVDELAKAQGEAVRRITGALEEALRATRDEYEALLPDLVFAACGRLIGQALAQPAAAIEATKHVLRQLPAPTELTVHLHPDDHGILESAAAAHPQDWPPGICFEANRELLLGGCKVETLSGTFDARLETQLRLLRELLDAARPTRSAA